SHIVIETVRDEVVRPRSVGRDVFDAPLALVPGAAASAGTTNAPKVSATVHRPRKPNRMGLSSCVNGGVTATLNLTPHRGAVKKWLDDPGYEDPVLGGRRRLVH